MGPLTQAELKRIDEISSNWTAAYQEKWTEFSRPRRGTVDCDGDLAELYTEVLNSPAMNTILSIQHNFDVSMRDLVSRCDRDCRELTEHQNDVLEKLLEINDSGDMSMEDDVNNLTTQHTEEIELKRAKCESEITDLQYKQRKDFRDLLSTMQEELRCPSNPSGVNFGCGPGGDVGYSNPNDDRPQESFTIHLGTQLKTMHNLRLMVANMEDFCVPHTPEVSGIVLQDPRRIQTAMSLYSNELSGLVIVANNKIETFTEVKQAFDKICHNTTEFHFPNIDEQYEIIKSDLARLAPSSSHESLARSADQVSLHESLENASLSSQSCLSTSSGNSRSPRVDCRQKNQFKPGDTFITRHSNLSSVQVVFHLVGDNLIDSPSSLSSQHPTLQGLRNIFRAAMHFDVVQISVPLLLVADLSANKSLAWCLKRAELVFKCVKGFLIETSTWTVGRSRTVQFYIPRSSSIELFNQLSEMLPTIFRISTPVVLSNSSNS